jgi:hypothetical protein
MIKDLQRYKTFGTPTRPRRARQKLNKTALQILRFMVEQGKDIPDGYNTYSNDPKLRQATGKSQHALSVALRQLGGWNLLECDVGGMPVLYWLNIDNIQLIRRVLDNDGYVSALLVLAWARRQMGWFTNRDIARTFNVSKRHGQELSKILSEKKLIKRHRLSGRGYKGRVVYTESKGQLPLDHFTRSIDILKNIKHAVYTTLNEFS